MILTKSNLVNNELFEFAYRALVIGFVEMWGGGGAQRELHHQKKF